MFLQDAQLPRQGLRFSPVQLTSRETLDRIQTTHLSDSLQSLGALFNFRKEERLVEEGFEDGVHFRDCAHQSKNVLQIPET